MPKRSLLLLFILYHLSNSIKLRQTPPPPPPLPSFIPPPPPIPGMPSSQPQKKLKLIKWDNLPDALIQGSVFSTNTCEASSSSYCSILRLKQKGKQKVFMYYFASMFGWKFKWNNISISLLSSYY